MILMTSIFNLGDNISASLFFVLTCLAFTGFLATIYYSKVRPPVMRSRLYAAMLTTVLFMLISELFYIVSIGYFNSPIVSNIIAIVHRLGFILWIGIFCIYSFVYLCDLKSKTLKELCKECPVVLVIIISIILNFITYLVLPKADFNTINSGFISGIAEYMILACLTVMCTCVFISMYTTCREISDAKKRIVISLIMLVMLILLVVQILVNQVCVYVISCSLQVFFLYFVLENPDIHLADEIDDLKSDIDKSNSSKTDFLSNMSHEIRTPMNAIIGFSDSLLNTSEFNEENARVDIQSIATAGTNLVDIINNILDISKIESGNDTLANRECSVAKIVNDLSSVIESRLGNSPVKLYVDMDEQIPSKVYADATKLYQVLLNITNNAVKYTEVGKIRVSMVSEKTGVDSILLHIKISDTGYGIKKEDFGKLFEKFSRLDNAVSNEIEGTGLGLVITKKFVDLMGGKIWFESEYEVGTTFYVDVPLKVIDPTPIGSVTQSNAITRVKDFLDCTDFTALVVDDSPLNLKVSERLLKKYNFKVDTAESGKDCIYKFKYGNHYDIIFLDHMMPGMDGIETIRILRRLDDYEIPPIVALTANVMNGMGEKYLAEGFDAYLPMPIDTLELDRIIHKFFDGKTLGVVGERKTYVREEESIVDKKPVEEKAEVPVTKVEEPAAEKPVEEKTEVPETKAEEPVTEKPVEEKVEVPETKVEEPVTEKTVEEKVDVPETKVEEPTPEPGITTPPVSEEQKGNAIVSTPLPTNLNNPADALHNSDAQSEYNEALQDFLKIFDEERNETKEKGPFTTMEALNEFHDKYFELKEAANERLVNAKKRLEESRAKNAEQPRTTNTPNSSILALPAANKEKSSVLGLPAHVPTKSEIIDTYEGNPGPNMPKNPVLGLQPHKEPEEQKQPENNETKVKKGLYTIMEELTDGLELTRKMNGKYTASNIRVVKGFKEELKSGNVLYNIAHFATAVVAIPINFVRKVVDKLTYSMREKENVEKFKERLSKLSKEDLETIWNEYRGTRVIQERYAVIINTLINERMQQYALEKVSAIRKDMSRKYKILFYSMKMVESYDKLLQTETDLERIAIIKQEREKALAGKAEMISSLRSQNIEANQILSGGAHGVSEDMKAGKTKLTIAGKRFAKDHDFNNELAAKQAEIEKRENAAIAKGDNEAALRAFIDGETLLRGKTEIKNTIYGQRSVGEKYSMPLPQGLDYRDDPFVRDLLRTVAYVGMGISAANALITHGPKSDALLQQNKADTDRVNAANDATIKQVHQAGDTLTGNRDDFITGMQSQTGETSVNISQSLERETLDSNSWYLGTEYNKMDAFNHARYNAMSDAAKAKLEDIATKCYNNQITDMQALEMIKEVANTQHQNLIDIYTEYQPILEQYASTHPFDLHGVQESMQFVLDHPDAVIKMNEGMVESIQVGEELAGLSAEHIAAINSLPSDLATTLFGVATSTAALTYQAASTMNNNVKSGKYGNEITDMIQDYIDSKAKANEAAPEEKSSGSGKSR